MIDEKDLKILEILKANSRFTNMELSKKTGIAATTVHNRIKKMEKMGIITGYRASVDHRKLGKGISAFVLVRVRYHLDKKTFNSVNYQAQLRDELSSHPAVEECHIVTGGFDTIMKIRVKDIDDLNDFLLNYMRRFKSILSTKTLVILSTQKDN